MSNKDIEGQIDFLGLLTEYTDEQGATVRVSEPKPRKKKAKPTLEFEDLDQLELDLDSMAEPAKEPEPKEEPKKKKTKSKLKDSEGEIIEAKPEEPKPIGQVEKPETRKAAKATLKPKGESGQGSQDGPFKDCDRCWCNTCKHNARLQGVPREMCGKSMPCPACKTCTEEGMATICEIGNAEEGCMTRALEEGLVIKEEYIE